VHRVRHTPALGNLHAIDGDDLSPHEHRQKKILNATSVPAFQVRFARRGGQSDNHYVSLNLGERFCCSLFPSSRVSLQASRLQRQYPSVPGRCLHQMALHQSPTSQTSPRRLLSNRTRALRGTACKVKMRLPIRCCSKQSLR
jgi:hypothetical protein